MYRALAVSLLVALVAVTPLQASSAKRHPTTAERAALLHALPGQKLCYPANAWVSASSPRYAVVVTQAACGATLYNHTWLRRSSSAAGPWAVVARRSGTIDHPAGCAKASAIPADIRCL